MSVKIRGALMKGWDLGKIDSELNAAAIDPAKWSRALEAIGEQAGGTCILERPLVVSPARDDGWTVHIEAVFGGERRCFTIQRDKAEKPAFSEADRKAIRKLAEALARSASLSSAIDHVSQAATLEAFDVSNVAAVLLDRQANVLRANRSAERLMSTGVRIVRQRLVVSNRKANAALKAALNEVLEAPSDQIRFPPIKIPRRGNKRPMLAHLLRLRGVRGSDMAQAQAAIVLMDPTTRSKPWLVEMLIAAFNLTPAEAALAAELAAGRSLKEIQGNRSALTVRNQLKRVFSKTHTHRQAELVLMISQMM